MGVEGRLEGRLEFGVYPGVLLGVNFRFATSGLIAEMDSNFGVAAFRTNPGLIGDLLSTEACAGTVIIVFFVDLVKAASLSMDCCNSCLCNDDDDVV